MAKIEKRQRNLLIILLIVIASAAADFTINTDDYLKFYANKKETMKKKQGLVTKPAISEKKELKLTQYNRWGRDPFYDSASREKRIVYRPSTPDASFQLSAISIGDGGSIAMINNQIITVGGEIEGYTVKSIEPKQVVLEKNGQIKTVRLQ